MTTPYPQLQEDGFSLEQELAQELNGFSPELVPEFQHEHANEREEGVLYNHLAAMADRRGQSQALRRVALAAAKAALRGRFQEPAGVEGEFGTLSTELQTEVQLEWNPARQAQLNGQLEHLGHVAAEAATEEEAAQQFFPLVGLAAKLALPLLAKKALPLAAKQVGGSVLKKVAPRVIGRVAPQLTRGLLNVSRTLFRNPTTRPLLHAIPRIARGTVADLARDVLRRRPVDARRALSLLARRTARTLHNPRTLVQTYRNSLAADRRYHQSVRRLMGSPPAAAGLGQNTAMPQAWTSANGNGSAMAGAGVSGGAAQGWSVCPTCGR
jgi:hypothetical protein